MHILDIERIPPGLSYTAIAQSSKRYSTLALYFELVADRDSAKEVSFLLDILSTYYPSAHRMLDLACGTGRHARILRQEGFDVLGIDSSDQMLQIAGVECPGVEFQVMDMRYLELADRFDAALCMWTAFNYLSTQKDVEDFLDSAYHALKPQGLLILDLKSIPGSKCNSSAKEVYVANIPDNREPTDLIQVIIYKHIEFPVHESVYFYFLRREEGVEIVVDQEVNRIYRLDEVRSFLAGRFDVVAVFGDYSVNCMYDEDSSDRMLMVCRKCE